MRYYLKITTDTGSTLILKGEDPKELQAHVEAFLNVKAPTGSMWLVFDPLPSNIGHNKISCIKLIRDFTSLGLKEAKDLVESTTPINIIEGDTETLRPYADALRSFGMITKLIPSKTRFDRMG